MSVTAVREQIASIGGNLAGNGLFPQFGGYAPRQAIFENGTAGATFDFQTLLAHIPLRNVFSQRE